MSDFVFVYVTNPTKEKAKEIAGHLVQKRLIACANIFAIDSVYRWEGKIADEAEFVMIAKTSAAHFEAVKAEVESIHPYKVPCVVKIPVRANEKYFDWLMGEIEAKSSTP